MPRMKNAKLTSSFSTGIQLSINYALMLDGATRLYSFLKCFLLPIKIHTVIDLVDFYVLEFA